MECSKEYEKINRFIAEQDIVGRPLVAMVARIRLVRRRNRRSYDKMSGNGAKSI